MSSTIYCGTAKLKKGQKRGNMAQCAAKGQVRFYGIEKIDKKTLASSKQKKVNYQPQINKLTAQFGSVSGRLDRIKKDYSYASPYSKPPLKAEYEKLRAELVSLSQQIKDLKKKQKELKSK